MITLERLREFHAETPDELNWKDALSHALTSTSSQEVRSWTTTRDRLLPILKIRERTTAEAAIRRAGFDATIRAVDQVSPLEAIACAAFETREDVVICYFTEDHERLLGCIVVERPGEPAEQPPQPYDGRPISR